MKKLCLTALALIALLVFTAGPSWAGNIDKLIDKLVEKKILTKSEATELINEMQAEEAKEKKEVASKQAPKGFDLPKWVENTKVKGDIRVRYENQDTQGDIYPNQNRGRVRLRLGAETKVNEQWVVGVGLATGSDGNPRSVDQTFTNNSSSKDIWLDYAFAQFTPAAWASIVAGKFKNPLWNPEQLMWDGDINPEGIAAKLKYEPVKGVEIFGNIGWLMLDESGTTSNDPYLIAFQPGVNLNLPGGMYLKAAGTYYNFNYVDGKNWATSDFGAGLSKNSNSQDGAGNWIYDYDSLAGDVEFGMTKIPGPIPYAAVFAQYVHALDAHNDNDGWLAGFKFGDKSIKDFGDWQVKYNYRRLERDAWPDFLPCSTAYNGTTNIKGHNAFAGFGIYKNVFLSLTYWNYRHLQRTEDDRQNVLQADLNVKF
ncbi:MAG: putative porin [Pseudomonadota bacterium]